MKSADLQGVRSEFGLTQVQMAERLDIHPVHYGRMETGAYPVSRPVMLAIGLMRIVKLLEGRDTAMANELRVVAEGALGVRKNSTVNGD